MTIVTFVAVTTVATIAVLTVLTFYSRDSFSRLVFWLSGGVLYSKLRVHGSNPCAVILYFSLGVFVGVGTILGAALPQETSA